MNTFSALLLRSTFYMGLMILSAYLFSLEGFNAKTESVYGEDSVTELLHDTFAFLSAVILFIAATQTKALKPAAITLATLLSMMLVREFDEVLDTHVFDGAWQLIVLGIIISSTIYIRRLAYPFKDSLLKYANTSSAGIFLSGLLVVIVFSRLIGRGVFWQSVMGENYLRVVKNIAEEGTELLGYTLLLIAAIEFLWVVIKDKRARVTNASE